MEGNDSEDYRAALKDHKSFNIEGGLMKLLSWFAISNNIDRRWQKTTYQGNYSYWSLVMLAYKVVKRGIRPIWSRDITGSSHVGFQTVVHLIKSSSSRAIFHSSIKCYFMFLCTATTNFLTVVSQYNKESPIKHICNHDNLCLVRFLKRNCYSSSAQNVSTVGSELKNFYET